MNTTIRIVVVCAVLVFVVVAMITRPPASSPSPGPARSAEAATPSPPVDAQSAPLPRLVSLGAGRCIPCKAMEPIREEIKAEYVGRLTVEYHDIWQDRSVGEQYGIRLIPTLIYFDAAGRELGRTEGFRTKEQILQAFRQWGVDLARAGPEADS